MTHPIAVPLGCLLTLAALTNGLQGQDTVFQPQEIRLVTPPPLSRATAELEGPWQLRINTPGRRLVAKILLVQDTVSPWPCPFSLSLRSEIDSSCLRAELPQEWIYLLGYAAGQQLHVVRVRDTIWAVAPGDGIISGISRTGDLTLVGVMQHADIVGRWTQSHSPDSLRGTFTLRRTKP